MLDRHKFQKKTLNPDDFARVVVMPDKSCQVAWQENTKKESRREGSTVRASPVILLQATVGGSPLPPNSAFSSPGQQHMAAPAVSPKDGTDLLPQRLSLPGSTYAACNFKAEIFRQVIAAPRPTKFGTPFPIKMSRGGVGAALGAAGATAYLRPDLLIEWAQRAATSGAALGKDTLSSKELDQLTKMVEQLTREVRTSGHKVTAVHSDSSLRNTLAFYLAMATTAGALYLVVGRGWRFSDLGWVTQRVFRQVMTGLSTGIDSLSTRLTEVKNRLAAKISEVSRKQDEAATAAAAMRAHLADVGADVETVRNQVGQLHSTILNMDVEISDIGVNQRHALHGIYILCKAVSELSAGSNIASKTELLEYTKSPVWQRVKPQGLEGILQETNIATSSSAAFQGDEPWLRQRYMLGTVEGELRGSSANRTDDSSAAFMKALPSRDLHRDFNHREPTASSGGGGSSSGFGGNAGGYNAIRRPSEAGGFDRFGVASATDVRRENPLPPPPQDQRPGGFW